MTCLRWIVKLAILAVLAVAIMYGYDVYHHEKRLIERENVATERCNRGEYREAAELYESLLEKASVIDEDREERLRAKLALCYVSWAESDYGLSMDELVALYRRARELDPDAVKDETILRLLDTESEGDSADVRGPDSLEREKK